MRTHARRRRPRRHFDSVGVLYAHAFAIESEAQSRYLEFAQRMSERGNATLAELFGRLAALEAEHTFQLAMKNGDARIERLAPHQYAWLESGAPVPQMHAPDADAMTPRRALQIALEAEERGMRFFEDVCATTRHVAVRKLAAQLAREEALHLQWVKDALSQLQ